MLRNTLCFYSWGLTLPYNNMHGYRLPKQIQIVLKTPLTLHLGRHKNALKKEKNCS